MRAEAPSLTIAAVERDTGIGKDALRVWERRYGFPRPLRDAHGERVYPSDQVETLRLVKRLLDAGHRPGRIVPLGRDQLQALSDRAAEAPVRAVEVPLGVDDLRAHLDLLRSHDTAALRTHLVRLLSRLGVARFVNEVIAPLNVAVGDAWLRGQLEVFEEHMYTEVVQVVLRQAIGAIPPAAGEGRPRVLLTTFPGEPHGLGLLMAEAVLALEGCACLSLGTQTPLWDIVLAAAAQRADIVALGFTGVMNPNQITDGLTELRSKLPASTRLWAGGSAPVLHRRRIDGVEPIGSLEQIPTQLHHWRGAAA